MTKLSICIPVLSGSIDVEPTIASLLTNPALDLDIVVAHADGHATTDLEALAATDARVKIVAADADCTERQLWKTAVTEATGDWVSLIRPGDALEAELVLMVDFLERTSPTVDALAWNVFQIDPSAEPAQAASIAIPSSYHIESFDKTAMLKAFFYWKDSLNSPKMPFGLYHAAIRRSLIDIILQLPQGDDWTTPVPQYEWASKVLLCADALAFSSRPMSAINLVGYQAPDNWQPATNFPFHAGLGLTGAIAEVQFHVLRDLGSPFDVEDDFVRACMIDSMMEKERPDFLVKGNAYYAALQQFEGGRLSGSFRPEFHETRTVDRRRGLHGGALLVDRFIGGARTAQEILGITRWMMAPIGLICGGVTK